MRIRKISQSAAIPGKIVNSPSDSTTETYSANYVNNAIPEIKTSYNTSTTEPYSCNYINNLNTYSTTEHRIGTWINRKTNI